MMLPDGKKWAYSHDGEVFYGEFDSWYEAALEALCSDPKNLDESTWVGQCESPCQPDDTYLADIILEHVACQDDYMGDWAEGWPNASQSQTDELDVAFRKVFGEWLDRHKLRPKFYIVPDSRQVTKQEALEADSNPEIDQP